MVLTHTWWADGLPAAILALHYSTNHASLDALDPGLSNFLDNTTEVQVSFGKPPERGRLPSVLRISFPEVPGCPSFAPIHTLLMKNSGRYCSSLFNDCDRDDPLKIDVEWQPKMDHWRDLVISVRRSVPLASLKNLLECRELTDILNLLSLPPRPLSQGI